MPEPVKPVEGTETPPGTVKPVEGHGTFFEFTDDQGNPIDTSSQAAGVVIPPTVTPPEVPPMSTGEPQDPSLEEPDFKEMFGFDLETYDDPLDPAIVGKPVDLPSEPGKTIEPKKDPSQAEYWQSQADVRGSDLSYLLGTLGVSNIDEFRANYQEYKNIIPIARYIKQNPGIVDNLGQTLAPNASDGTVQGHRAAEVKEPAKPARPSGYNKVDAYQDPESGSFKYREELEDWRDNMFSYQSKLQVQNAQVMEQQRQQEHAARQMEGTKAQLINQYQFAPNDAVDFINYMASPKSESLDNLVMLWKMHKMPEGTIAKNLKKANDFKARTVKQKLIKPGLGGTSGPQIRELTEEEKFNAALIGRNRRL